MTLGHAEGITALPKVTITTQKIVLGADFLSSNTTPTFDDVTGMSIVMPNRVGGFAIITFVVVCSKNVGGTRGFLRIVDGANNQPTASFFDAAAGLENIRTISVIVALNGQTVKLQASNSVTSPNLTIWSSTSASQGSRIDSLEIS